jgi:hypothetical protein
MLPQSRRPRAPMSDTRQFVDGWKPCLLSNWNLAEPHQRGLHYPHYKLKCVTAHVKLLLTANGLLARITKSVSNIFFGPRELFRRLFTLSGQTHMGAD